VFYGSPELSVLDLGCGFGAFMELIRDQGIDVVSSGHRTSSGQPRRSIPRRLFLKFVLGHHYGELDSFVTAVKKSS
jgi:hypothetical protein